MTENDIRIEHIKVKELPEFANRVIQKSPPGQFVPISMQRAIAHANNPYADDEDIGLLVAVDGDGDVVGYFGIMPMLLRVGEVLYKTHWFTTWSVSSKVRGKGVGTQLMEEALTLNKDYLIVGSVYARRVCAKFGFWEREPMGYYWIDMSGMGNLNPLVWLLRLTRKLTHLLKIDKDVQISNALTRWIDHAFSPVTKKIFYRLLSDKFAGTLQQFHYQEVSQIRPDFPQQMNRPAVELHRGGEAVNWMLAYPWILETGNSPTENMNYYFSDTRPLYRLIALELTDPVDGSYLGFVVFSVSQKENGSAVKTLDFKLADASQYPYILALAVHYGKLYASDTIEIPDEIALPLKTNLIGRLLLQAKKRIYQCHPKSADSPLATAWHEISLHLYDGDMAFS